MIPIDEKEVTFIENDDEIDIRFIEEPNYNPTDIKGPTMDRPFIIKH